MFPPIGWRGSFANMPESGLAVIYETSITHQRERPYFRRNKKSTHLIRDDHGDAKLVGHACQRPQELGEFLLPRGQFATSRVVGSEERGRTVHDDERVPRLGHHGRRLHKQLHLVLRVVGTGERDIVEHTGAVETVSLGDRDEPLRTECAFRVDEQRLAFTTATVHGQLTRHANLVAQLRLARAELAENLRDRTRLEPAFVSKGPD
jgi:hypothetical protein